MSLNKFTKAHLIERLEAGAFIVLAHSLAHKAADYFAGEE